MGLPQTSVFFLGGLCALGLFVGCDAKTKEKKVEAEKALLPPSKNPTHLYIPQKKAGDASIDVRDAQNHIAQDIDFGLAHGHVRKSRCPQEMVLVSDSFCIDRYEVSLVDKESSRSLSPHYPPSQEQTARLFERWLRKAPRSRRSLGRLLPVPEPPAFQLAENFSPKARSQAEQIPSGYLSRKTAELACENAGKRLCHREEWQRACRGENQTTFPYGNTYQAGVCNVHRQTHPSQLLHGNSSKHHLDPRLGLAHDNEGTLLRPTGATSRCVSRWGNDAIYDMVGNLDEWIDEPSGAFLGGFFSRATRKGCDASIDVHSPAYLDYSLGTRCCMDDPL